MHSAIKALLLCAVIAAVFGQNCNPTTSADGNGQICRHLPNKKGLWYVTESCQEFECASTTNYMESSMGSCGCGNGNSPFPWQYDGKGIHTAAGSMKIFDQDKQEASWCGEGCGDCYHITPTGGHINGEGASPSNDSPITIMITNLCPPNPANDYWCAVPNHNGYMAHFDLMSNGWINSKGWENPEVYFKKVACPANFKNNYQKCQCHGKQPYFSEGGIEGGKGAAGS